MGAQLDLDDVAATSELATRELAELRAAVADSAVAGTLLTEIVVRGGGLDVGFQGGAAQLLAEALAKQYADNGGVNYIEMTFESRQVLPGQRFIVTVQRRDGKTPHALRREAEAEAERLRGLLGHNTHYPER